MYHFLLLLVVYHLQVVGFNDGSGYYFARDIDGGIIALDTWKRGNDRTNSNFVIMGNCRLYDYCNNGYSRNRRRTIEKV